jgi:NADPH2:quinone reductase
MRSLQVLSLDGPSALRLVDVPEPDSRDRVLIEVHVAGVTFPDLLMTQGRYQVRPELPFAPGVEVAGVVRFAPEGSGIAAGDRVTAYMDCGGYSELVAVPAAQVVPIPAGVDFATGVALLVNYQTAYFGLAIRGRLAEGEVLLVHGAAGGVGTAAVQVGRGLGARVLAVVSDDEKAQVARTAGADEVLDVSGDWVAQARQLTDGRGVDVVFDPVGGDRFDRSLRTLAPGGRALVIGFAEGRIQSVAANYLLLKNIEAVGVAWGIWLAADPSLARTMADAVAALLERGVVAPIIGARYPLAEGAQALVDLAERRTVGKSIIEVR